jgi:myo-inositol-1(or 4)-monophosphatase
MELNELCTHVRELTKEVGAFIQAQRGKITADNTEHKGLHDLVTYVDKTAEQLIIKGLQPLLPEAGFIAEENTSDKRGENYNWIIDPLDGTTNFIHGLPCYCISIALMHKEELVMGVVHELNLNECFYACKGSKAYLNGKEIRVSTTADLQQSLIATGFPYTNFYREKEYMGAFNELMKNTRGLRRLGSAAVDLCYVACGRFDAYFEYDLKPWDAAAGAFIVMQAGGKITDFKGGNNFLFGKEMVACNSALFNKFYNLLQKYFC